MCDYYLFYHYLFMIFKNAWGASNIHQLAVMVHRYESLDNRYSQTYCGRDARLVSGLEAWHYYHYYHYYYDYYDSH
jgi:hypothetical protein